MLRMSLNEPPDWFHTHASVIMSIANLVKFPYIYILLLRKCFIAVVALFVLTIVVNHAVNWKIVVLKYYV